MKITCVIQSMGGGGAERVMAQLSALLAEAGHGVTLVTLDSSVPDAYEVPERVSRVRIRGIRGVCRWYELRDQAERIRALRENVLRTEPALVISFMDTLNVLVLAAFLRRRFPIVVCEHTDPRYHRIGPNWDFLRRCLYPSADLVVLQNPDIAQWARGLVPSWKTTMIPNPVFKPHFTPGEARPVFLGPGKNLAAMGRLSFEKGFDLLLDAFGKIAAGFPEWQLNIMGEGPLRRDLERKAAVLGLQDRVKFAGFCPKPYDVLKHCDLFALSSRYEGFGMALTEAMSCGVPAVAFDCPSGPGHIVRPGIDGFLVPPGDAEAFSAALSALMSDKARRAAFSVNAMEVTDRFSGEKYAEAWTHLITGLPAPL